MIWNFQHSHESTSGNHDSAFVNRIRAVPFLVQTQHNTFYRHHHHCYSSCHTPNRLKRFIHFNSGLRCTLSALHLFLLHLIHRQTPYTLRYMTLIVSHTPDSLSLYGLRRYFNVYFVKIQIVLIPLCKQTHLVIQAGLKRVLFFNQIQQKKYFPWSTSQNQHQLIFDESVNVWRFKSSWVIASILPSIGIKLGFK